MLLTILISALATAPAATPPQAVLRTPEPEITADDLRKCRGFCSSACVVEFALRRLGLIGDVRPDRIRLCGRAPGVWCVIDIPSQLRRFMRLFDQGVVLPPPTVAIEVPNGWGFFDARPGQSHRIAG